jgi:predicted house-cleaning noncanonical NTP pyrophosphatase (MazG superfamily)
MANQTRKTYNKLVRDRIPEIIAAEGRECATKIMEDAEYRQALLTKLVEEAQETAEAESSELLKELADLYEVIEALLLALDLDRDAIRAVQQKRHDERGGFEQRIKLLWTE